MSRPVVIRIDGSTAGLERALSRIDGRLAHTGRVATRAGGLIAASFGGAAIARGAGIAISTAGKFDQAITNTGAVSGATAKQVAQLEAESRKLGIGMGVGATQAAMAATELVKGGLKVQEVISGAEKAAIQLSLAGDVALPQAAESMASAMQIFKVAGKDATFIGDQYVNFANQTTGSVESIVMGMSSASAAGKNAWKNLRGGLKEAATETVLSLAVMQRAGQNAQDAGTTVKTALNRFGTKVGQKALAKFDVDVYDAQGNLKNLTGITKELRKELGGLNGQQRTGAIQAIFGSDGGRLGQALLDQTPKKIDALRKAMAEQGTAEETARKKSEGYVSSMNRLKAAREELLIVVGKPTADALAGIATELSKSLGDPRTTKQLSELGDILKDVVVGGVRGLVDGLQDGTIQKHLGQIVEVAKGGAETLGHFASAGADVLEVIGNIPGPVLAAAASFAVWRAASAALLAPLAGVGARGLAAVNAARGVSPVAGASAAGAAGSRAPIVAGGRGPVPFGPQPAPAASAATVAAAQARASDSAYRQVAAQRAQLIADRQAVAAQARITASTAAGPIPAATARANSTAASEARAAQAAAAQQRAAADRARQMSQRDLERARTELRRVETRQARVQRGKQGAGIAAAAGLGVALSGGDTSSAMMAAGAVGMMGGPMVAAGAALGAGAVSEIVKYTKNKGKKEFEELGQSVTNGMGRGNTAKERKTLTNLQKRINDAAPKTDYAVDPRRPGGVRKVENSQEYIDANIKAGKLGAVGVKRKLSGAKFIDARDIVKETKDAFAAADPIAKTQAAATMTAWAKELEAKGKLSKGAASRVAKQFGIALGASGRVIEQEVKKADIQGALGAAVGNNKKQITKLLNDNSKMFTGIEKPAKTTYRNIIKIAESQLAVLAEKMRTGTASQRKAAATEYQKLASSVDTYFGQASRAMDRFGTAGTSAITSLQPPLRALNGQLDSLAPTIRGVADALSNIDTSNLDYSGGGEQTGTTNSQAPPPKKKRKNGRRGGRFQGGGIVDIAVSPQELGILPDGRSFMVPGSPVAADSVSMSVPAGTEIYTGHGQELLASGLSRQQALREQMPHFATGGKVTGKTSWFGGPNDASTRGRKTKTGTTADIPGVAIRPGATFQSGTPFLNGFWDVHVGGKNSVLKQIDLGPHQSTGKRIDITSAALGRFGFTEKTFPTGSTGWAAYLGKDRAKAIRRAAAGKKSGDLVSDIMVGASTRGRDPLIADAYSQAFQRAAGGTSAADIRNYRNLGIGKALGEAVASAQTTRRVAMQSSSLGKSGGGDSPLGRMIAKASAIESKGYQYAWGGGHGRIGVPGNGSRHAHGRGAIGLGFDCSGAVSAVLGAGGLLSSPLTSGALMSWGKKAKGGEKLAVYSDPGHVIMRLGNRLWGTSNSNPKGGPGWLSRNTMQGRGVVRTATGFRGGGVAGRPKSTPIPDLEEGFRIGGVAHFRGGGSVSGASVITMVSGGAQEYTPRIDDALSVLTQARVERLRREIQRQASAAGSKAAIVRAQAALAIVDDELGERAGTAVAKSNRFMAARSAASTFLGQQQRINGTAGTAKALRDQQDAERRFIANAPAARDGLEKQIRAADRAKDYEGAKALREALVQLNNETQEAAANVADLGREAEAAAESEKQAAIEKRGMARVAGMKPLDLEQAEATLTKSLDDDKDVQAKRIAEAQSELEATRADVAIGMATPDDIIAAINVLTSEQERGNAIAEQAAADANAKSEQLLAIREQELRDTKAALASMSADARGAASWQSLQMGRNVRAVRSSGSHDPYARSR